MSRSEALSSSAMTSSSPAGPPPSPPPSHLHAADDDIAACLDDGMAHLLHGRIRRAHACFQRTSLQLAAGGDVARYARSLALVSYAAACIGHTDEAMQAGFLGVRLTDAAGSLSERAFAHNYLGVALMWNGTHDEADVVLRQAIELATQAGRAAGESRVNACCNEILRQMDRRQHTGRPPATAALGVLLDEMAGVFDAGRCTMVQAATPPQLLRAVHQLIRQLHRFWSGDLQAVAEMQGLQQRVGQLLGPVWLGPMLPCMLSEAALARGRPDQAAQQAMVMVERATAVEHERLAALGLNLAAHALAVDGRAAEALAVHRQLLLREQAVRSESLQHRRRVAEWEAQLHEQRHEAALWRHDAQRFRALSLQDALTGLGNRRAMDALLGTQLGIAHPRPLHVLVVDVDHFKQVNDRHTHPVGDRVLRAVGQLLRAQLRADDVAARIGGDEFVIACHQIDDHQAALVCERVRAAVQAWPWHELSPGLAVTISAGWAAARLGDSVDSLLARADRQMYADKATRRRPAAPAVADRRPG